MTTRQFLERAQDLAGGKATRSFYRQWAASYDGELAANGYATPERSAAVLAAHAADPAQPVLDLGCGTGLAGVALREAGFRIIDGADFSAAMLARARARNLYRRTFQHDLADPLPAASLCNAVAVGVLGPGHAPAAAIDHVTTALMPGGVFVFSLNDHARKDPAFEGRIHGWVDCGTVDLVHREEGPHLPGCGIRAVIYALCRRG